MYGAQLGWKVYDHIEDPEVSSLIDRITVKVDESFSLFGSSIEVEYDDGSKAKKELNAPTGEPENPISWEGVKAKFMGLATDVYGEKRSAQIADTVERLEKHKVSSLAGLIS